MSVSRCNSFVAVDVETANSDRGSICQIGVVSVEQGQIVDEWQTLVDPGTPFSDRNVSIHGLTAWDVESAPAFSGIYDCLMSKMKGEIVACHTMFDRSALRAACSIYRLDEADCLWLDTAQVVRKAWNQFSQKDYKLDKIATYLGIEFSHHDALEDARTSALVLLRAVEETGLSVWQWQQGQTPNRPVTKNQVSPGLD